MSVTKLIPLALSCVELVKNVQKFLMTWSLKLNVWSMISMIVKGDYLQSFYLESHELLITKEDSADSLTFHSYLYN